MNEYMSRTKLKTYQKIIKNAEKLFYRKGIGESSIQEIADISKVSRPTVYSYFETKHDIVLAVLYDRMNEMYNVEYHLEGNTPIERLRDFMHLLLNQYLRNPKTMKLLVGYYESYPTHSLDEDDAFQELDGVKKVLSYLDPLLEPFVTENTTMEDAKRKFFTIFNFNIAIGMRYGLRQDTFIGYGERIDIELLYKGLDHLVELMRDE